MSFICKYCGKEVGNKGCLILHENNCIKNPNHILSKTQLTKIDRDNRRNKNGKISGHKHSEETKKRISEKRKQWLLEHKDQHVWRRDSKFLSEPCERLKSYLKEKSINFVEEYEPFNDINYCVDIAWPDEKIAIEVNGNQHYNKDGSLSKYYQKRHNLFESRGWKIFEIHYTKCYNININDFKDILNLPIYDKNYVGKYFSKKELKEINKKNKIIEKIKNREIQKQIKQNKIISIKNINKEIKLQKENKERKIIYNLLNNSGIDFTKSGWSTKAYNYLLERNELWNKGILRCIRKYYPEFLKREDVWKRKGSIY